MGITLEQIDILRKRANVNYKEAKEALEKFDGDLVAALAYLEEEEKIKPEKNISNSSFYRDSRNFLSKLRSINFVVSKDGKTVLNISSLLALIIGILSFPISLAIIVLLVVTHHKIRLEKDNGEECGINDKIDKFSKDFTSATDKIVNEFKE